MRHPSEPPRLRSTHLGTRYAIAASTFALLIALTGATAYAAGHFLITSTSQIKPSVLRRLRGPAGARGATGQRGPSGTNGTDGHNAAVAGYYDSPGPATITQAGGVTVATLTLPAGNYLINASVQVDVSVQSAGDVDVVCTLRGPGGAPQVAHYDEYNDFAGANEYQGTLAFVVPSSETAAGAATVSCIDSSHDSGGGFAIVTPYVSAVQTSANTNTTS